MGFVFPLILVVAVAGGETRRVSREAEGLLPSARSKTMRFVLTWNDPTKSQTFLGNGSPRLARYKCHPVQMPRDWCSHRHHLTVSPCFTISPCAEEIRARHPPEPSNFCISSSLVMKCKPFKIKNNNKNKDAEETLEMELLSAEIKLYTNSTTFMHCYLNCDKWLQTW